MKIDLLSDIFRLIRLKASVYFVRDFRGPFGMSVADTGFAQFHAVIRGRCLLSCQSETIDLEAGDIVLFPHGDDHVLSDRPGRVAVPGKQVMASFTGDHPMFNDGDNSVKLLCGHYRFDNDLMHPLIESLPDLIHLKRFDRVISFSIDSILPFLVGEMNETGPGSDIVTERLAEILLIQIFRCHLRENQTTQGFLSALTDNRLARAIALIHGSYVKTITLEDMAAAAGMSRSSFAMHFRTAAGISPNAYLMRWRLACAHTLLREQGLSIGQTANRVGYESEVAFSRAFKRLYDISPSKVRVSV